MGGEEVYARLWEHLHRLPGGFPATKDGHETRLLKKLFNPEEAELAMALRPVAEEIAAIAPRLGLAEAEAEEKIENLAEKGLIFRVRDGERKKYMAISYVVGIFEFQLGRIDREFAELFEAYKMFYGIHWLSSKTKQLRTVPVGSAISSKSFVETYDRAREFVMSQDTIALADCICRKKNELLGKKCDNPRETCLVFGDVARFYMDYGMARPIGPEEALAVLDLAEKSALILSATNTEEHAAICSCCTSCCGFLSGMKLLPNPGDYVDSTYQAAVEPALCNACGECLKRCQMAAIDAGDPSYSVNQRRCVGCGLCVSSCDTGAISLVERAHAARPEGDFFHLLDRINAERCRPDL
jgi:ferredoxin